MSIPSVIERNDYRGERKRLDCHYVTTKASSTYMPSSTLALVCGRVIPYTDRNRVLLKYLELKGPFYELAL